MVASNVRDAGLGSRSGARRNFQNEVRSPPFAEAGVGRFYTGVAFIASRWVLMSTRSGRTSEMRGFAFATPDSSPKKLHGASRVEQGVGGR